mgnify:CR=1 FL=1
MDKPKENIDHLLSEMLSDAQMSAEGIDWNAFQAKRKRKRLLWWFVGIGSILGVALLAIFLNVSSDSRTQTATQGNENVINGELANSEAQPQLEEQLNTRNEPTSTQNIPDDSNKGVVKEEASTNTNVTVSTSPTTAKQIRHQATADDKTPSKIEADKEVKTIENTVSLVLPTLKLKNTGYPALAWAPYPFPIPDSIKLDLPKVEFVDEDIAQSFLKFGFGPTLVNPRLVVTSRGESLVHKDYMSIRNAGEQNAVGFHLSGMIGKKINRFAPYIGFGFSHNAVLAKYNFVYSEKPIQDLNGTILGYQKRVAERVTFNSNQSYSLVDIPIGLEYELKSNNNRSWNLIGQVSPQILVSAQGNLPNAVLLNQRDLLSTADYKLNTITGQIGFNYTRQLGDMQWFIEPKIARNVGLTQVKSLYNTRFNMIVVTFGIKK